MFDNIKKFVLPDQVLTAIRDAVVDKLAEHLDGKNRELVLKFRSDGKFQNDLNAALERAVYRFTQEHEDQPFVDAVARNTDFWSLRSVQEAVKEMVIRPSSYLESEFAMLRQTFAEVVPTVDPERVDAALHTFLRCIADEVMNIPQLAPIYQVQLQKISTQQGRDMIEVLKDTNELQRQALMALLEVSAMQNRLLLAGPGSPMQLDANSLQELRKKYFESILQKFEFMDMGGISPRVTSKAESRIVSIRMEDVFIPLRVRGEKSVYGGLIQRLGRVDRMAFSSLEEDLAVKAEVAEDTEIIDVQEIPLQPLEQTKNAAVGIGKMLENQKGVVLGHPGAGKTTIGKYIAYMIAAQGKMKLIGENLRLYIPVIVKAAEFGKFLNKNEALSFFSYVTGKQYSDDYGPLFEWALRHNQCLMIIDGLDEVADPTLRVRVATKVEQFVSDYWGNRFVVTSRIVGYKGNQLTGDFTHFTLTDLEKDQIIEFLKNWYIAVTGKKSRALEEECKRKGHELWQAIEANEGVKKLAGTPLLLTIIALVNYYGSKLPDRRVELYQLATETLLSNWPLKQRGQRIDSKEILSILEPIAHYIFTTSEDRLITEYEFRPLFEKQVSKFRGIDERRTRIISSQLLDKIEQHTGFFLKRGTNEKGQDVYGFLHPTFAEYLTARYLAQRWVEEQKLEFVDAVHESTWHEVVLLMAGHLGTLMDILATRLVDEIEKLASPYEEYLHRDLLLVAEIIGDNVPVFRERRDEIISQLISLALDTPYKLLWRAIVKRLADIADAFPFTSQPKLLKIQESDSIARQVRKVVLSRSIRTQKETPFEILFQGLFADQMTSELAWMALISIFDALRKKTNQNTTKYMLVFKEPRHFYTEFDILAEERNYYKVSEQIAQRISQLQLPILDVKALLEKDEDPDENALQVFLVDLEQFSKLDASKLASLIYSFQEQKKWSRIALIYHLLPSVKSINAIIGEWVNQIISTKKESKDFQQALEALDLFLIYEQESIASKKSSKVPLNISGWITSLQSFLRSDGEPEVHGGALKILARIYSQTGRENDLAEMIIQRFNDPRKEVRLAALSVGWFRKSRTRKLMLKAIKELLSDPNPRVRSTSARWIISDGTFEDQDVLPLINALSGGAEYERDFNYEIGAFLMLASKAHLPETLSEIGNQLKRLIEDGAKTDENYELDYYYFEKYNRNSPSQKEMAKVIIELFSSDNAAIRWRAILAWRIFDFNLQRTPTLTPLKISHILSLLNDNDSKVKLAAIEILSINHLNEPDVIEVLIDALNRGDTLLKGASIAALSNGDIRRQDVVDKLLEILKGDDPALANRAAAALANVKEPGIRKKIIDEVGKVVASPKENKDAYYVLWNLLVSVK